MFSFTFLDSIEYIAILASMGYIIMSAHQRMSTWLLGFVGSALYIVIFFSNELYGSTLLSTLFTVLMLHGWIKWRRGVNEPHLPVTLLTCKQRGIAILVALILTPTIYIGCSSLMGEPFPPTDAAIAGLSIVSQTLVSYKKLDAWYGWVIINPLAVYTYANNHLVATALLYVVYSILSIYGLRAWYISYKNPIPQSLSQE